MLLSLITSGTVPSLPSWVGRIQNQVESRAKAYTALKEAYGTHSMTALSEVIAKYAMATNEKSHAMRLPDGTKQSEELAGPAACRLVAKEGTGTHTFFYLNSVIDWPFNFKLHDKMVANPSWREKNASGGDINALGNFMYGLDVQEMKAAWIATCVTAVKAGCAGCFIDQANLNVAGDAKGATKAAQTRYSAGHLAALTELSHELALTGNYPILNHFGVNGSRAKGMSSPVTV